MTSESLHPEDDGRASWPVWKLLVATAWPAVVLVAYIGSVLLPLLLGLTR